MIKSSDRRMRATSVFLLASPLGRPGGVQRYTETLTEAFQDLLGRDNVRRIELPEAPGQGSARIPWALKCGFAWRAVWEIVRQRPDLIVCTHLGLAPIGWLLGKLGRRPYWVVIYGIEAWGRLPTWKASALRLADRVITISDFTGEQVSRLHHVESRRLVTLPGVLDEGLRGASPARDWLSRWSLEGRRVVLTVARLAASEQYKGHDVVLQALPRVLEKVPNLTYLIVGDGDDRPRLEAMAERLNVKDHVAFAGSLDMHREADKLAACYEASEVFVLPARTVLDERDPKGEGFGIVFLEAMAFGKPVIGPNNGAPAELIRHGEHGLLVKPEDPAAIAQALIRLLNSPDETRRMGESASQWVRQKYSYQSLCQRLRALLQGSTTEAPNPVPCGV